MAAVKRWECRGDGTVGRAAAGFGETSEIEERAGGRRDTELGRDSLLLCHRINPRSFKHQLCFVSLKLFQNSHHGRHFISG